VSPLVETTLAPSDLKLKALVGSFFLSLEQIILAATKKERK